MKIETRTGTITIKKPDQAMIKRLQDLFILGVLQFDQTIDGADFGIVMQYDDEEVYCLKQQSVEMAEEHAQNLFFVQHVMIVDAYCRYIKSGFPGIYLAAPYLRQRSSGLWEAGIAHFIYPPENKKELNNLNGKPIDDGSENDVTHMILQFKACLDEAFRETNIGIPHYTGIDFRPHSQVGSMELNFMVSGSDIFCLRADLREREDMAWPFLAGNGIDTVYHLPSVPIKIEKSGLGKAKGRV